MVNVQVVLDGSGADLAETLACVGSLLRSVPQVEFVRTPDETRRALRDRHIGSVRPADSVRQDAPLLITSGHVVFAAGAVRQIVRHTQVPGRVVTRVFIPGLPEGAHVTCWSSTWVSAHVAHPSELLDAGLIYDAKHLPPGSPTTRSWVRGDELGVSLRDEVSGKVSIWAARTGAALYAQRWWGQSVRAPAGATKRRLARRRQRRAQSVST